MTIFTKVLKTSKECLCKNWTTAKKSFSSKHFWLAILVFLLTMFAADMLFPDETFGQIVGYKIVYSIYLCIGFMETFRIELKNRFIKVLYYIGLFLMFELSIRFAFFKLFQMMYGAMLGDWATYGFIIFGYPLLFYSIMNFANHVLLIYSTIYRFEKEQVHFASVLRSFLIMITATCLFVSTVLPFSPSSYKGYHTTFICCQGVLLISIILSSAIIIKTQYQVRTKSLLIKYLFKIMGATNFPCYVMPILIAIVKVLYDELHAKLTMAPFAFELQKTKDFEKAVLKPFGIMIACFVFVMARDCVLNARINFNCGIQGIWCDLKKFAVDDTQRIRADVTVTTIETDV